MARLTAFVLFVVIGCNVCPAQYSAAFNACAENAATQTAIRICAGEELRRADAELNEVYKKLLSMASPSAGAVEKIRVVERAWLAFRDAYMDAMFPAKDKQAQYGSKFPADFDLFLARLNQQQTNALRELLKQYDGSKP